MRGSRLLAVLPGGGDLRLGRVAAGGGEGDALERILVETDAPYLTPKPQRGKPNAPYLLPHTVTFLADLLGIDLADFCRRVTANTEAAYATRWGGDA